MSVVNAEDVGDIDGARGRVAWEGSLATPSRQLAVLTVLLDVLVEREVGPTTPLKVIVNDDSEPDQIYVVIGPEVALGR